MLQVLNNKSAKLTQISLTQQYKSINIKPTMAYLHYNSWFKK